MATPRKCLPPSSSSEIRLHVAGMDCADEAALIRHALARPGISLAQFRSRRPPRRRHLQSRSHFRRGDPRRGRRHRPHRAHRTHAGDHVGDDHAHHDHHHDTAKWWAVASGAMLADRLDRSTASYADSWTEAVFGDHGEHRSRASSGARSARTASPPSPACARWCRAPLRRCGSAVSTCTCWSACRRSARRRSGNGRKRRRWRSCSRLRT